MTTATSVDAPRHPAKYSEPLLPVLTSLIRQEQRRLGRPVRVLDPFAGVGRIHRLAVPDKVATVGIELEPEWAACHPDTIHGDSLAWMRDWIDTVDVLDPEHSEGFDLVVTSPCYGNRLADQHDAQDASTRRSYRHDLGRPLSAGSSAGMQWGKAYWTFHAEAYRLIRGVLRQPTDDDPGGLFLLNVSDFIRGGAQVPAVTWHRGACYGAGMVEAGTARFVETQRLTYGENRDRAQAEVILRMRPVQ